MRDHVYKVVELVGSSKATIEDAVKNALSKSSESIRNSRWFEVNQIRGEIEDGEVSYWQVALKLGFTVEGDSLSYPEFNRQIYLETISESIISGVT